MGFKDFEFRIAGEDAPFCSQSKASLARILLAVIRTGSKIIGSHAMGHDTRDSVIYSLEVPKEKIGEFEELAKVTLSEPYDIQLGMNTIYHASTARYLVRNDDDGKIRRNAKWESGELNKDFWREALVGRVITDIKFDEKSLIEIVLDNGEVLHTPPDHPLYLEVDPKDIMKDRHGKHV